MKLIFCLLIILSFAACTNNPIQAFKILKDDTGVTMKLETTPEYDLGIGFNFRIKLKGNVYGRIFMEEAIHDQPFAMGIFADIGLISEALLADQPLVTELPNGQPFLAHIPEGTELHRIRIHEEETVKVAAYVGSQMPYYLGFGVEFCATFSEFPDGFVVTQPWYVDNVPKASITIYGPPLDPDLPECWGLFLIADIPDVDTGPDRSPQWMKEPLFSVPGMTFKKGRSYKKYKLLKKVKKNFRKIKNSKHIKIHL